MTDEYFSPKDCYFFAGPDTIYDEEGVVLLEIWLKDSTSGQWLGSHNLVGLPEYIGPEDSEGCWFIEDANAETITRHMKMCGFTWSTDYNG